MRFVYSAVAGPSTDGPSDAHTALPAELNSSDPQKHLTGRPAPVKRFATVSVRQTVMSHTLGTRATRALAFRAQLPVRVCWLLHAHSLPLTAVHDRGIGTVRPDLMSVTLSYRSDSTRSLESYQCSALRLRCGAAAPAARLVLDLAG